MGDIPSSYIFVSITPPSDYHNDGNPISQSEFHTNTYLTSGTAGITYAISSRGLTNQIDYIGTIGQAVTHILTGDFSMCFR